MDNKIKATKMTLNRAEGPSADCGKVELDTMPWALSDAVLREWALTAPDMGYDKVDFTVHFEDGETYSGRFDMQAHHISKSGMIAEHIVSFVKFCTGEHRPSHMTENDYTVYIQNFVPNTQDYKDFLANYELG